MDERNISRYAQLLRAGRWFRDLPEDLQARLLRAGVLRVIPAGRRLFSRGDPSCGLYGVVDGGLRITAAAEGGREALLTLVEPPAWFGEISVFDGRPRTHDAVAEVESRVVQVPQAGLDAILAAEPRYWRDLGLLLAGKLRLALVAMEDAAILPLSNRLARRLVLMAEGYGEWHGHSNRVVKVRQEQLAGMLSTSRQTANHSLRDLEVRGLLRLSYGQIEILDLEGLRRAAEAGS
jgi:CRP/FNR family transcriptional regulator, cyclic AMP receptor protein